MISIWTRVIETRSLDYSANIMSEIMYLFLVIIFVND